MWGSYIITVDKYVENTKPQTCDYLFHHSNLVWGGFAFLRENLFKTFASLQSKYPYFLAFSNKSKLSLLVHTFLALENPDYSCQREKQIIRQSLKNVFKPRKTQIEIRSLDHQQY